MHIKQLKPYQNFISGTLKHTPRDQERKKLQFYILVSWQVALFSKVQAAQAKINTNATE